MKADVVRTDAVLMDVEDTKENSICEQMCRWHPKLWKKQGVAGTSFFEKTLALA